MREALLVGVSLAAACLPIAAVAAQELTPLAPQPLPMAVRDGRVAAITVHAIPFGFGARELEPEVATALAALAADVAQTCFLTAQAVGHVLPGTPGDGEAGDAHQLARLRAEFVRASLIRAGLPAAAVAAVSDYQFTVREPRVTLWLFRAADAAECKQMAAAAAEPPPVPIPVPVRRRPVSEAAIPDAPVSKPEAVAAGELRFDSGSSFLPGEAEAELKRVTGGLEPRRTWQVELTAGVDAAIIKPGDPELSARYNRWLADRRLARVGEWLEQHVEVRGLKIARRVAEADPTPRVNIRVSPLP